MWGQGRGQGMEDEEGIMEMFALFIKIGTNQANGAGQNRK